MEKDAAPIAGGASCAIDGSCRLDPAEMPERVARWRSLFGHVTDTRLTPSQAVFQFNNTAELKSELSELIKLESICCAQVSWLLGETPGGLALTLKAGPEALRSFVSGFMPAVMGEYTREKTNDAA